MNMANVDFEKRGVDFTLKMSARVVVGLWTLFSCPA